MRPSPYWITPVYNADIPKGAAVNALGRAFDTWLERKLHEMFDSVTLEPLPAELMALVTQLDGKKDRDNEK